MVRCCICGKETDNPWYGCRDDDKDSPYCQDEKVWYERRKVEV